jgi:hypothetical protein
VSSGATVQKFQDFIGGLFGANLAQAFDRHVPDCVSVVWAVIVCRQRTIESVLLVYRCHVVPLAFSTQQCQQKME